MFRKYGLPLAALGMLLFAVYQVVRAQQTPPKLEPPVTPAQSPFGKRVAGSGLVEAQTENIAIGANLPGIVTAVYVKVGQSVKQGEPLFAVDDRQLKSELRVREALLKAAEAQLDRLEKQPRTEELPAMQARVQEAEANLADQEDQRRRARRLYQTRTIGEEELVRREQAARVARAQWVRAEADYKLLLAGAWGPDKLVAEANVLQAKAQVAQTRTEIERLKVLALVAGDVLQVNVRQGEFVGAQSGSALVVLGNIRQLHVRVDIDEHDIPRFRPGRPARAMLRGDPSRELGLRFVRVEPYVIPKKSLTGDNTERVDTRVLQVIYALEHGTTPVYVGQQLDVFVEGVDG